MEGAALEVERLRRDGAGGPVSIGIIIPSISYYITEYYYVIRLKDIVENVSI